MSDPTPTPAPDMEAERKRRAFGPAVSALTGPGCP